MKLSRKLAYSFGAIATALSFQAFSTYIIFFYVDIVKLPAYLATVGIIIYAVWNAVNDPLIGYLSDHTRSRWGRRIPYIAFGAIPFGLVYYFLWVPPFTDYSQAFSLFLYFVFFICLFDGFYTLTILNWSALYPEMFASLPERSQVNAFRQTFAIIGLILGISLPPLIFGRLGWGWLGLIFGAIIAGSLLVALWGSSEHKEFSREKQLSLWPSLKATFKNQSFLTFALANLFVQYTFILILATLPFFAKYVLAVDIQYTALILGVAFLVAIPMLYLWEFLAVKFGAKKCYQAAVLILLLALLPILFTQTLAVSFFMAVLVGLAFSGIILITDLIISDIVDEDETRTNTRREGMYFGVNSFIARLAIALEAGSLGTVFMTSGYNPYVYTQTREFVSGVKFLLAGFPLLALTLAFIILWFYPLSGKKLVQMEKQVDKIHLKKGVT